MNNARGLFVGSLKFFSDEALSTKEVGNKRVVKDLIAWTFQKSGIIRVKSMSYHGNGVDHKETLFNVG